jgi:hypothetical protein
MVLDRTQPMVRWLLRCVVFALPLVALTAFTEVRMRTVPNSYTKKRAALERRAAGLEVLVLGSSHAFRGVAPVQLSAPALNLADLSQSLYYDQAMLQRNVERLPRLRAVILAVSYHSLWFQLNDSMDDPRVYYYRSYWGIAERTSREVWDPRHLGLVSSYDPATTMSALIRRFHVDLAPTVAEDGWSPHPQVSTSADLARSAADVVTRHHSVMKAKHFGENVGYLQSIADLARARGLALMLVTLPVSRAYRACIDIARWAEARAAILSVTRESGCSYHNYIEDPRFSDADFADADHLNPAGARRFTGILDRECLQPALRRHSADGAHEEVVGD